MRHGNFSRQRQAEARATGTIGHEWLEETREHLWGDPTSGITDPQEQVRIVDVGSYAYHPAAWGVL